jgi:Chalcone isomerase-like
MKRNLLLVLVSVMTACGVGVAYGKDCQGVTFPEQVQLDGGTLRLNGLGLRQATFLKVNVYVAALYVAHVSSDAPALLGSNSPKELILHFLRNVSDDDLKKAWEEGFEHNAKAQLAVLHERIKMLQSWMVDMKSGQRLTFLHTPGAGIQVEVNGTVKGLIKGDDFATAFLSIWLGDHPPNPNLKSGLLGGACE